jgi:cytochrome c oxidase assembly protein subunit 15
MPSHDQKINKLFYYWLLLSLFLVFAMIIVGGLTRLTNSGLSITEWELFEGILPPMNSQEWEEYFDLYKKIPQYILLNNTMSLSEFKIIFFWEYYHRFLGRIIGIFFLFPLLYFYLTKKINKKYIFICFIILLLILTQGFVGWYMVKSGLVNNVTVSHYRLSLHLIIAFFIISIIFWLILNVKEKTYNNFFLLIKDNYLFYFLFFLVYLQIIIGAFVSGLDAGLIYQTWPLMDKTYFPNDVSINSFTDYLDFNNHGLVQFIHRNLGYSIVLYVALVGYIIFIKNLRKLFKPFYLVLFFILLQIILGILTLISGLNIYLASSHQICSLFLILSLVNLYYHHIN